MQMNQDCGQIPQHRQQVADEYRQELYAVIREAHQAGMTLRAITEASGLSFGRIHQIIKGTT